VRTVELVVLLVALATVVAAFAVRLRVPAPSLLVAAGLAVGLLPGAPMVHVPPAVVSLVVLPPLAAALSIPLTTAGGAPLPQRDLVLVLAAAAIVISLIVQGFTLEPLARRAGFGQATTVGPGHEETVARLRMAEAGLARLEELADDGAAPDAVIDRLRATLQARIGHTRARLDAGPGAGPAARTERALRGDLIAAENAELSRLFQAGTISAATRRRLQRSLDLETARLTEGQQ
jgi:hypothetical protein